MGAASAGRPPASSLGAFWPGGRGLVAHVPQERHIERDVLDRGQRDWHVAGAREQLPGAGRRPPIDLAPLGAVISPSRSGPKELLAVKGQLRLLKAVAHGDLDGVGAALDDNLGVV